MINRNMTLELWWTLMHQDFMEIKESQGKCYPITLNKLLVKMEGGNINVFFVLKFFTKRNTLRIMLKTFTFLVLSSIIANIVVNHLIEEICCTNIICLVN